ncbi:nitric oxide synthase oxygenase [Streptacidiphilus sp. PB12-B1b]|uniref:nitric oxide synthase oxygenase n=1 Tax=Streptacidiphilus sp. PB12-B1b TaxID=2705012 RepID=UPI0015FC91EA|nr:nitric oxide synthase oxygenase [Streptacidiphilus sp. PB12-B1b]QMU77231.1 nitric oxide synthase oxygenase [Streptacidiphilus sp. PB12-B1b]
MRIPSTRTVPTRSRTAVVDSVWSDAKEFLTQFAQESRGATDTDRRLREVRSAIEATGTYRHTTEELTFGARLAWRNAERCIGRLYWNSMTVRDLRHLHTADDIAEQCVEHLRTATNGGRVRPLITVFAPDRPGRPTARLLNEQLVRYADDPRSRQRTHLAQGLGWTRGDKDFDVLPLLTRTGRDDTPRFHELPSDAVLQVPLTHPQYPAFASLGLRWYAVPAICDMALRVGGVTYPTAPFNGWYMGTEIGARNLADTQRYNLLPTVAQLLGLDTSSDRTLWKDRALVELNLAVLHSYQQAGVTITDHHTESARFLTHIEREEQHGRTVAADWSWIVPPISASATPVFHRYYDPPNPHPHTAFVHHASAADTH